MIKSYRTDKLLDPMPLPCGGTAYWDESSGFSFRCECGAIVGSIGMPAECRREMDKWDLMEKLGGKGWDYFSELDQYPTKEE
jgi:hypothetical protein